MAQLDGEEILKKLLISDSPVKSTIRGLVDRETGTLLLKEGALLDYKERVDLTSPSAIAELARDILAFSNTQGGILLFGIDDEGKVKGHEPLDGYVLRQAIGKYVGTRVNYHVDNLDLKVRGSAVITAYLIVQRTNLACPNLLKRDIETVPPSARKVKYRAGSLFFREADQTRVDPPGPGMYDRALSLGFTYATPRARSSLILAEDRPGYRIYDHINDQFYGRELDVAEILSKFENPKGRGVSIAGLGGIGKTELAIEVVLKLSRQRRFKRIYSSSAKTLMMTPLGLQHIDPMFSDFRSFLRDLATWLGLDVSPEPMGDDLSKLSGHVLQELQKPERTLLFVDNLETMHDRDVFDLLNDRLPDSVSLITTSRVHKVRNYMFHKDLAALSARESARLLRHELQRQGLDKFASTDINQLAERAEQLFGSPLAIRWYAWACARQQDLWAKEPSTVLGTGEIEEFCVAHTLKNLPITASKTLSAIAALQDQGPTDTELILAATKLAPDTLDRALWELDCAGLIFEATDEISGKSCYSVVPLAQSGAREIARKKRWEPEFVRASQDHFRGKPRPVSEDPLVAQLIGVPPRDIRHLPEDEREKLLELIRRVKDRTAQYKIELLQLEAECERHRGNVITSRDLYSAAAEILLQSKAYIGNDRYQHILLEAATVARSCGLSFTNLKLAAKYLEAVVNCPEITVRVPAMLAEISAGLGDEKRYREYRERTRRMLEEGSTQLSFTMRDKAEAALSRAEELMQRQSS